MNRNSSLEVEWITLRRYLNKTAKTFEWCNALRSRIVFRHSGLPKTRSRGLLRNLQQDMEEIFPNPLAERLAVEKNSAVDLPSSLELPQQEPQSMSFRDSVMKLFTNK